MANSKNIKLTIARLIAALDASGKTTADIHVPFSVVELNRAGYYRHDDGNFRVIAHVLIPKGCEKKLSKCPPLRYVPPLERPAVLTFRRRFHELGLCPEFMAGGR